MSLLGSIKTFLLKIERVSRWDLCSSLAFCQRRRRLDVGSSARRLVDSRVRSCHAGPGKGESAKALRALCLAVACGSSLSARGLSARLSFAKGSVRRPTPAPLKRPAEIGSRPAADGRLPAQSAERCAAFLSFAFSATRSFGPKSLAPGGVRGPVRRRRDFCALLSALPLCSSLAFGLRSRRLVGSWARGLCFATARDKRRQKLQHRQSAVFFFAVAFTAP